MSILDPEKLNALDTVVPGFAAAIQSVQDGLDRFDTARDTLKAAAAQHPDRENDLYHSLDLLTPTSPRMNAPAVYAAHCAELADRIAHSRDTKRGTAVEVVIGMMGAFMVAPLDEIGTGLCYRLWARAGLPDVAGVGDASLHHEALHAAQIDDAESNCRTRLTQVWRVLGAVECDGIHHGEVVACRYAIRDQRPRT